MDASVRIEIEALVIIGRLMDRRDQILQESEGFVTKIKVKIVKLT